MNKKVKISFTPFEKQNKSGKVEAQKFNTFLKLKEKLNKEVADILYGGKETQELQKSYKNESFNYFTYIMNYICYCYSKKDLKKYYSMELKRAEKLLDIKIFKFHLIQAYLKDYNDNLNENAD